MYGAAVRWVAKLSDSLKRGRECKTVGNHWLRRIEDSGEDIIKCIDTENNIAMFGDISSFKVLPSFENIVILGDGTFQYCPKFFKQLYTLHVCQDGHYYPLLYFLLPNKKNETYETMLQKLKVELETVNVSTFLIDFEASMVCAVRKTFPQGNVRACYFHLAQNWLKTILNLGLFKCYKARESFVGKYLRKCFSLPGLEPDMVGEYFATFSTSAPDEVKEFVRYLKDTYITPKLIFPHQMWAGVLNSNIPTTTNACETFHRHFGDMFGSSNRAPTFISSWRILIIGTI